MPKKPSDPRLLKAQQDTQCAADKLVAYLLELESLPKEDYRLRQVQYLLDVHGIQRGTYRRRTT